MGEQRILRTGALLAAAGLAAVMGTGFLRLPGMGWWLGSFFLVGAGLSNVSPVLYRTAGRVPGVPSGTGIATAVGIGYAGLLTGPPVLGFVGQHAGLTAILFSVMVLCCILALAAPVVGALTRKQPA
jgi:hypothetical protein